MSLRNGTYLREPDGACNIWFSPYSFEDAVANFRKRDLYDDGWHMVVVYDEIKALWALSRLTPGEYVKILGGKIV